MEKIFPSPDQKWPEFAKLRNQIGSHTGGWVQEFAKNNGIRMSNDGIGPPHEEVVRKIVHDRGNDQRLKNLYKSGNKSLVQKRMHFHF